MRLEELEDRKLLAILWFNETDPNNGFANFYGTQESVARQLVNRAIDNWEAVITDFNYDGDGDPTTNNTYNLTVSAGQLNLGERGRTSGIQFANGRPTQATITLDDNGGGDGWFFDQTPLDDAEFTAIVNSGSNGTGASFQASFVDVSTSNLDYNDFYRTVVHEIGHAVGVLMIDPLDLNSGNWLIQNQETLQTYSIAVDTTDDLLGPLTYVGVDQATPARTQLLFDPNTGHVDPFTVANEMWQYTLPGGATITFTEDGGGHLYEGPVDPNFTGAATHPNDLMNPGRTVPPPGGNPIPTTRQFISDLDAQLLADAYGYAVALPSTLDTAYASLDSETGSLLVQGGLNAAGQSQNDTITVDVVGSNIRVQVNGTTELFASAAVSQIVIAGNGGTDTITWATTALSALGLTRKDVQYVVSTNQDLASAGTLGDNFVDHDTVVPGRQVSLRSAIIDARGTPLGSSRAIYVPRGNYNLTINGSGGDTQGDLDLDRHMTIIGSGAGATIIDGSALTTRDRIFETLGTGSLDLSRVTLTGGQTPSKGGAIRVNNNPTGGITELTLREVAIVGNTAINTSSTGYGGGIYLEPGANALVLRSVITDNTANANSGGGGIYADGNSTVASGVLLERSIVANNASANAAAPDLRSAGTVAGKFTSNGGNLITSTNGATFGTPGLQGSDYVNQPVDYVVTSLVDSFDDTDNAYALSTREAVNAANTLTGTQKVWLPAWDFMLTRDRVTYGGGSATDTDVGYGDLDIQQSLIVRGSGIAGATSVRWRPGVVDAVFDLLGDYNGDGISNGIDNGTVNSGDYTIWQNTLNSTTDLRADGDDNGVIEQADYNVWIAHFGNTFNLSNVSLPV